MALPRYSHPGYTWADMQEAARRKAMRACRGHLADLVGAEVGAKRPLGEAKAAYRAKNELDL